MPRKVLRFMKCNYTVQSRLAVTIVLGGEHRYRISCVLSLRLNNRRASLKEEKESMKSVFVYCGISEY